MIQEIWFAVSLFLVTIIFFRMPKENTGLTSFANKSDILGSPTTAERTLNIITALTVLGYIIFAFKLDLDV